MVAQIIERIESAVGVEELYLVMNEIEDARNDDKLTRHEAWNLYMTLGDKIDKAEMAESK